MNVQRYGARFAVALVLVFLVAGSAYAAKLGERNPEPAVNVVGKNLKIALAVGERVPDDVTIKMDLYRKLKVTEIRKTLRNGFENAFEGSVALENSDANLVLEVTSLKFDREVIAALKAATYSIKYRAQLRLAANGEIIRTAAAKVYAKNPLVGDRETKVDDVWETMWEDVAAQLFAGGNFVLPEIPESEPNEGQMEPADKPAA